MPATNDLAGGQPDGQPDRLQQPEQPHALIERRGHVLLVTMNRPEARNALSGPMMALMRQAWDEVDADPQIRVAVLTGAGGAFCARSEEHTSELQSQSNLVCRLLLEKKKK